MKKDSEVGQNVCRMDDTTVGQESHLLNLYRMYKQCTTLCEIVGPDELSYVCCLNKS
jgi:hypothetical protein